MSAEAKGTWRKAPTWNRRSTLGNGDEPVMPEIDAAQDLSINMLVGLILYLGSRLLERLVPGFDRTWLRSIASLLAISVLSVVFYLRLRRGRTVPAPLMYLGGAIITLGNIWLQ